MNDRYLYRAKRIDNGELVEGNLVWSDDADDDYKAIIIPTTDSNMFTRGGARGDLGFENWYRVNPSTICQCTGLKDKNGKLIWENDIVGYYNKYCKKWCYGLVGYGEFNCSCCSGVYGWHFGDEDIREYKGYEVKGNIFENPELLESEG